MYLLSVSSSMFRLLLLAALTGYTELLANNDTHFIYSIIADQFGR